QLAVNANVVKIGVGLRSQFRHHLAVYSHPPGENQFLRLTPRRNPRRRHNLLQTLFPPRRRILPAWFFSALFLLVFRFDAHRSSFESSGDSCAPSGTVCASDGYPFSSTPAASAARSALFATASVTDWSSSTDSAGYPPSSAPAASASRRALSATASVTD